MRLLAVLALPLLTACQEAGSTVDDAAATVDDVAAPTQVEAQAASLVAEDLGAAVFQARCATCHGPEGHGDGPAAAALDPKPVDLSGPRPQHLRGLPGGRRAVIEAGIPGSEMVGFKDLLTADELDAVYGFVHNLRRGTAAADCPGMGQGMGRGADCGADCGDCGNGQ